MATYKDIIKHICGSYHKTIRDSSPVLTHAAVHFLSNSSDGFFRSKKKTRQVDTYGDKYYYVKP